jgi:ferredoxin-type protein NapG
MGVLRPAHLETGLLNTRTPTVRFKDNWCDFCDSYNDGRPKCVEVCPTQALRLPDDATKENTIIGKAYVRHDWCLGWLLKGCRICYDACPYEAIELDEFQRPHIIWDNCNGCGKCEMMCISMKVVSIVAGATHRAVTIHPAETVAVLLDDSGEGGQT